VLASAFASNALADDDPSGLENRAAAGATTKTRGWTASLFVTRPTVEKDAPALGAVTTVGARLSRPISRRARLSVDVFNIFDKPAGTTDYFVATHSAPRTGIVDTDYFHPADGRGIRLGLKITF
jgi:hypothetical protein